nr:zinc-binding dehydrogenase [Microbacterium sp. ARD31]
MGATESGAAGASGRARCRGRALVERSATFTLDDAADAYRSLEEGHTRGKIVVRVD